MSDDALLFDPDMGPYLAGAVNAFVYIIETEFLQHQLNNPQLFDTEDANQQEDWMIKHQLLVAEIIQQIITSHRMPFILCETRMTSPSVATCDLRLASPESSMIQIALPIMPRKRKKNVRKDKPDEGLSDKNEPGEDQRKSGSDS